MAYMFVCYMTVLKGQSLILSFSFCHLYCIFFLYIFSCEPSSATGYPKVLLSRFYLFRCLMHRCEQRFGYPVHRNPGKQRNRGKNNNRDGNAEAW